MAWTDNIIIEVLEKQKALLMQERETVVQEYQKAKEQGSEILGMYWEGQRIALSYAISNISIDLKKITRRRLKNDND